MGPDGQFDQGVARPPASGRPLAAQADGLAVDSPNRNGRLNRLAIAKGNALLAAENGIFQINVELGAHVRALGGKGPAIAETAAAGASAARSEHIAKDVV